MRVGRRSLVRAPERRVQQGLDTEIMAVVDVP
jgi:hypothetical protein